MTSTCSSSAAPLASAPIKHTEQTPASGFPFGAETNEEPEDDMVRIYEEHKERLSTAIESTTGLLGDFSAFNTASWSVRYPEAAPAPPSALQRRQTFAGDGPMAEQASTKTFNVLNLDLHAGHSRSAKSLVGSLEQASISQLLNERITIELAHLASLRARVEDTASSVLVTGDLNSGKSTLVNALLRREVMPVDQQPTTSTFCSVLDAKDNAGLEEVHMCLDGVTYDQADARTFTTHALEDLEALVVDADDSKPPLKVYVNDVSRGAQADSLIHNGQIDISLIDAPGLNRDSLQTTSVFARQDEIDVVVFCVSAANHFTLSAKEFIWTASNEKAYLFIVVNRYDQIRDKERCRRAILEQVKALSPRTWEERDELVHFVDSNRIMTAAGLGAALPDDANTAAFSALETSLRSFVLDKRLKSKLLPARTFVGNLLSDLDLLATTNVAAAAAERLAAEQELERNRPVLEGMQKGRERFERTLEEIEDETVFRAGDRSKERLSSALAAVSRGELAPETALTAGLELPAYPGVLDLWDYAKDVKVAFLRSLDEAVRLAEDDTRALTAVGVNQVGALGEKHLPEGVERPTKVFRPSAMFARGKDVRRRSGFVGAVGLQSLASRDDLTALILADIYDVHAQLARLSTSFTGTGDDKVIEASSSAMVPYTLSALGAVGLVYGKTLATRSVVETFLLLADTLRSPAARKWAGPTVALLTLGLGAWVIAELPRTVPRRVGANLAATLASERESFVGNQADRLSGETKRVLRAAAWNLRAAFTGAMDDRLEDVRRAEASQRKAEKAAKWFDEVGRRTEAIRIEAGWVEPKLLA